VSQPVSGATSMMVPVQGIVSSPATRGEAASTFCMNCVKKKIEPMVPRFIKKPMLLATLNVRTVKSFSSSMGAATRCSRRRKTTSSSTPTTRTPNTRTLPHPAVFPLEMPTTIESPELAT
jgi:hypothetical protein